MPGVAHFSLLRPEVGSDEEVLKGWSVSLATIICSSSTTDGP